MTGNGFDYTTAALPALLSLTSDLPIWSVCKCSECSPTRFVHNIFHLTDEIGGEKDLCYHCWVFWMKGELQWYAVPLGECATFSKGAIPSSRG